MKQHLLKQDLIAYIELNASVENVAVQQDTDFVFCSVCCVLGTTALKISTNNFHL